MEERCLHRVWVLSHKRRNAEPVSFRALPILYNLSDKSHSAPGRLKNVWGHSILLIKVSHRHSLKHLEKVIVDGGKKAVSKVRKISLLSNTTKRRCLHILDLLKQLLDKLKKAQLFDIYLDETTDISEEVQLILCCRFANQETKTIGESCCLNVGVCSTAQAIFSKLNQFIRNHGFDWMKYKTVATNGTANMQRTTNGVVRKIKTFPLAVFQPVFWGNLSVKDQSFLKWLKKRRSLLPECHFQIQN